MKPSGSMIRKLIYVNAALKARMFLEVVGKPVKSNLVPKYHCDGFKTLKSNSNDGSALYQARDTRHGPLGS